MTTITKERIELFIKNPLENGLTRGEQMELARIALASLEADPVKRVNSDQMRRVCLEANRHLDKYDAMAKEVNKLLGRIAPPAPVVPEEISTTHTMLPAMSDQLMAFGYVKGWNACRAAMLHAGNFRKNANSSTNNFREIAETSTNSPVTPALLPGGFTIEEAKELHEDLVRSHISKALSGEKMKKKDRDADLRWIHGVIVQAAWFVKASLEQNALSGNSRLIPGEVLSAIREVAKIRADFDDFDGDRRGIGDCLDEAEQELIVTISKYASQLAAEPIATNDVREQTAVPPVPEIQTDVAQAIENLKQKLVECNRYNYCADAVKGVEDASRVLALQNQNMSAPITPEAIENAIEYIRSIAFHIDEDDYHGKHIAYFMRQALALLEGHSCSNDRLGKADNQPVRGNQAAESNRGNEWTGNPDIDNAIIMLDRIDTLENCDDDRIEAVKAVLRRLAGNYPEYPDSCLPAPGKGVTGERIRIKPHVYRELVNRLHDTAIKSAGTQQLRERISRVLGDAITPDHHKQAEKSGLERCHLEAALNIKPGHTLGIIDALLVHRMAKALLPLVAEKHEADHANES
ncbi:TPA: dTDP-6-deoxy-L-hexose 3-O-methyltransferase [Escherichia coli]|nr:dTDP-6-deoxy-L-hexose 3-O-methyltransferase [Escherichia coli]